MSEAKQFYEKLNEYSKKFEPDHQDEILDAKE